MPLQVSGEVRVPGDKSISHRALLLAAAARGESRLRNVLTALDCESTARVLRAIGCPVPPLREAAELRIRARGLPAWRAPLEILDCGNSGTTARLMLGMLASRPFCATLTGDVSLRARPMQRVAEPLSRMGARIRALQTAGRLPLEVCGDRLGTLDYRSPVASAQVKSAVLLAGLCAGVPVAVREPYGSRDHTERMLRTLGVEVHEKEADGGHRITLDSPPRVLPPLELTIPGDPSAAAFLVALAVLADQGELRIVDVCVNPRRTGFFRALKRMGARLTLEAQHVADGEPRADLIVAPAALRGCEIAAAEVPSLVDEIPILAILAARATGETRIRGASELRLKESDRIASLASNLRTLGIQAEELPDGLTVRGSDRPLQGTVRTGGDHRIAMAFAVLGAISRNRIEIDDPNCVEVSFPGFWSVLRRLGAQTEHGPALTDD